MFEPELVFQDLKNWCDSELFGDKLWGKYGPANGINPDYGWTSPVALSGIVGPLALSVANLDEETSVWKFFEKIARFKKDSKPHPLRRFPHRGV